MADELLPCPFCGLNDVTTLMDSEQGDKWGYAYCNQCGARACEVRTSYDLSPDAKWRKEAIANWNQRTPLLANAEKMLPQFVLMAKFYCGLGCPSGSSWGDKSELHSSMCQKNHAIIAAAEGRGENDAG